LEIKKLTGIISENNLKKFSKDDDRVKYILREKAKKAKKEPVIFFV
jgi:hypothetical protein